MTSRRQRIIEALQARLVGIRITNGYDTDAGLSFYYGPVNLGPDDPGIALAMVPGTTETNPNQGGRKVVVLPIEVHVVIGAYNPQPGIPDNAWLYAEQILSDVKKAVEVDEAENALLGGLASDLIAGEVGPLIREEGGQMVGLRIEYRVTYPEIWGEPWR